MGIVKETLKAGAKPTDEILESVSKGQAGRTDLDPKRPRRPVVDRTPDADPPPPISPDIEGMTPESVAEVGATIGPVKTPPAATPDEAASALEASFVRGENWKPRTLNRNVNFDYVESPDGIKSLIDTIAEDNSGFMSARRGKRSHAETAQAAMSRDPDKTLADILRRKPGQIWNAERSLAARQVLDDATQVVYDLSRELTMQSGLGRRTMRPDVMDEDLLEFRQAVGNLRAIQMAVQGNASEVGRALNQFRIPVGTAGLAEMADLMNKSGGRRATRVMLEEAARLNSVGEISKFARMTTFAKSVEMLHFWRINMMLSGPVTHARNIFGNTLWATHDFAENTLAAGVGAVREGITGGDPLNPAVAIEEPLIEAIATMSAMQDAFKLASRAWLNQGQGTIGQTGKAEVREIVTPSMTFGTKPDGAADAFWKHVLPALGTNLLGAEDEWFKVLFYRKALAKYAFRDAKAARPGDADYDFIADMLGVTEQTPADMKLVRSALYQDMTNNPHDQLHLRAVEDARRLTFTDDARGMGQLAMGIREGLLGGRVIFPFVGTPARITQQALQRSPLGTFEAVLDELFGGTLKSELRQMWHAGGAARDQAIARVMLGNSIWLFVAGPELVDAMQGNDPDKKAPALTGSGAPDRDVAAAERQMGKQRSSVRIDRGPDKPAVYVDYRTIPVVGENLAGAASLAEHLRYAGDSPEIVAAIWNAGIMGMVKNVTTKAYLMGFSDVMSIINAPPEQADRLLEKFTINTATSYIVPNVLKQLNPDDVRRDTQASKDYWDKLIKTIGSRIPCAPGLPDAIVCSKEIPPRYDPFGNLMTYQSLGPRAGSPFYLSTENKDPVYMAARNNGRMPARTPQFFPNANGVDLYAIETEGKGTGWVYAEYSRMLGKERYRQMQGVLKLRAFDKAEPSLDEDTDALGRPTQRSMIGAAYRDAKQIVDERMAKKYPELMDALNKARETARYRAIAGEPTDGKRRDWRGLDF